MSLRDNDIGKKSWKRQIRKFPEIIIEPSGETVDLVEFIEMVLDFEEKIES